MWIEINCYECGEFFDGEWYRRWSAKRLREKALKAGWKRIENRELYICPECKEKLAKKGGCDEL